MAFEDEFPARAQKQLDYVNQLAEVIGATLARVGITRYHIEPVDEDDLVENERILRTCYILGNGLIECVVSLTPAWDERTISIRALIFTSHGPERSPYEITGVRYRSNRSEADCDAEVKTRIDYLIRDKLGI